MEGTVKPIKDCPFCCVPPAKRSASFHEDHSKCAACGVLMGPGHVEGVAEFCYTCTHTRQRAEVA